MIKKIRYKITNCFFVEGVDNKVLAVDVGWPNTLYDYAREMKSINLKFGQISWAIVTHFHMDHAGLFGEMINEGIKGIVLNNQEETINEMEHLIEKHKQIYTKINKEKIIKLKIEESRRWLKNIGINGEIINTPGHTDESISFISDEGEAIIGDLYTEDQLMNYDEKSINSWKIIRSKNVNIIYPSHADIIRLQ